MNIIDVVYGTLQIPDDIASIISLDLFQRLKDIAQVGLLYTAIPIAMHTRFDHCIGTYWQAKKMLDCLEKNSDWYTGDVKIPIVYRKAVEIAALLHDVGHGPFSHLWEAIATDFNHERNSVSLVDDIFGNLSKFEFKELREKNNYGIKLIKALILGDPNYLRLEVPKNYRFIFEIVNNQECNVDVDKWDYLKRDHFYLQQVCSPDMDFDSIYLNARISSDGLHVEYRYEDYDRIYALFVARWMLHVKCYRLPKNLAYDQILLRIVKRCSETICGKLITDINVWDTTAFLQLTDTKVLQMAKNDPEFKYIKDYNQLLEITPDILDNQEIDPDMVINVFEYVPGPGETMAPDERFHLYGNIKDKKPITRNMKPTKRFGHFLLL